VSRLSRLLKPRRLEKLLGNALRLAGPGAYAVVSGPEGELVRVGPAPEGLDPTSPPQGCQTRRVGRGGILVMGCGDAPDGDPSGLSALADLLGELLEDSLAREEVRRALADETLEQYREVALTQRATLEFNASMKLLDVVRSLLKEARNSKTPAKCGMVFIKSPERGLFMCFDSFGPLSKLRLRLITETRLFMDVMQQGKGEIVNDLTSDPRWAGELEEISALLILPLVSSGTVLGALVLAGMEEVEPFQSVHLKRMGTLTTVAGIAMANAIHFEQIQKILTALMQTMATTIDSRDRLTAGHSHRVARLAQGLMQVASADQTLLSDMQFTEADLQEIYYAGLLHDVGKIGVREEVLTKATRLPAPHLELIGLRLALWGQLNERDWEDTHAKLQRINRAYDLSVKDEAFLNALAREHLSVGGRTMQILSDDERDRLLTPRGNLTPEEWEEIKRHPAESHRILKNIPFTSYFPNLLTMIHQHHERLDGSGYPEGTQAKDIIAQSRMLAIVDIYDSLRRDRHYKKALSQDMALRILREEAAQGKLDKRLVEVFCSNVDKIERAVSLDTSLPSSRDVIQ